MGGDRLLKPPHLRQRHAEADQRQTLAVPVPGLPEDRGRIPVGGDRLLKRRSLSSYQATSCLRRTPKAIHALEIHAA